MNSIKMMFQSDFLEIDISSNIEIYLLSLTTIFLFAAMHSLNPVKTNTDKSMTDTESAIAKIAIRIIGRV